MLGVLPGIIGSLQALEAIKLILDLGDPLIGRLLAYDSLEQSFREYKVQRRPGQRDHVGEPRPHRRGRARRALHAPPAAGAAGLAAAPQLVGSARPCHQPVHRAFAELVNGHDLRHDGQERQLRVFADPAGPRRDQLEFVRRLESPLEGGRDPFVDQVMTLDQQRRGSEAGRG